MLVAHFADTHLGIRPYGYDWFYRSVLDHFRDAVDRALREGVDAIVFAGDVFDKPRPPNSAIKRLIDTVATAVEKGVRVYAVLGEHDLPKTRDLPPEMLVPGLRLLLRGYGEPVDCFTVDGREYCVGGVSHIPLKYDPGAKKRLVAEAGAVARRMGGRGVLVMHQNIVQFNSFEPGLEIAEVPAEPIYVAMGHIHRRIIYHREGGQVIAYPGSLEILRRDEIRIWREQGKGFYLVDLSGDEPSVEKIDTEVVPQEEIRTDTRSLRAAVAEAASRLPRNKPSILHVIVEMSIDEKTDVARIAREAAARISREIRVKVSREYRGEAVTVTETGVEILDEAAVLAEALGDKSRRDLAELILGLKEALVAENREEIDELLEKIAMDRFWDKKIPNIPRITLPSAPPAMEKTVKKPGAKGLLRFLGQ